MNIKDALRRLVDVTRLIDAHECGELYNELQSALYVAGEALHEADTNKPAVTVDSPEFMERVEAWSGKYHSAFPMVREGREDAWKKLIAHIDAHVAKAVAAEREAWGNNTFNYGFEADTWNGAEYNHEETQMAWDAWKARAALAAQPASPAEVGGMDALEIDFLEEWLTLASTPVGLECCGKSMGECCGNGVAVERNAEEVISAMVERHRELTTALAHKPASGEA